MPYGDFVEYAKGGNLPEIRYRLAYTQQRRRIAKIVISENQFCRSKNRKLLKVARNGYLEEIGRYPILREALERAGYSPPAATVDSRP